MNSHSSRRSYHRLWFVTRHPLHLYLVRLAKEYEFHLYYDIGQFARAAGDPSWQAACGRLTKANTGRSAPGFSRCDVSVDLVRRADPQFGSGCAPDPGAADAVMDLAV